MKDTSLHYFASPGHLPLSADEVHALLSNGSVDVEGLLPWSSNYTFLVIVTLSDQKAMAVYKPCKGERPLWDFPSGTLAAREVAAFVVSAALNWHIVPPTVLRDGPHGKGMLQLYIEADPEEHYFTFSAEFPDQLRRMALFDLLVNNADRKAGHCLRDLHDQIWAIDHGICFHVDPKLRTVIWDFAGQPIPPELLRNLHDFREQLCRAADPIRKQLGKLLAKDEIEALQNRAERLIRVGRFPKPGGQRHIPWPPV